MSARTILHVDMNAFYASVEQATNPEYRGKPVMVVMGPRVGIVATASYEARAYGIKTAMPVTEAKRLCPKGIFVPARLGLYVQMSHKIFRIYQKYSPLVEYYSVDEAFIDYTGCEGLLGPVQDVALQIKEEIGSILNITCSVGIGPNKLLAKMASDMQKPDGLTIINREDIPRMLWPLPAKDLMFVGRKTAAKLSSWGKNTIGDLAKSNPNFLEKQLGAVGKMLYAYANGLDSSPVINEPPDAKGCGHSRTLDYNVSNSEEIRTHMYELCCMISRRLRAAKQKGRTISFRIRYHDFYTRIGKAVTVKHHTNLADEIFKITWNLFNEIWNREPIRKIGIKVSNLISYDVFEQLTIFDELPQKKQKLAQLQDKLEIKYGEKILIPAALLGFDSKKTGVSGGRFGLGSP